MFYVAKSAVFEGCTVPVYTGKFWVHKPRQIKTEDEEWSKHY